MTYIISFLIPIYNHFEYLDQCIRSILNYINPNIELVCINDYSSDKRISIYLKNLEVKKENIKIVENQKNFGISHVLNHGVKISDGEYVAFVDCDDFIDPSAIDIIVTNINKYPKMDYFFSDRYDIDKNNNILRKATYGGYPNISPSGNIKSDLLEGMVASHLKVIKKTTIKHVGGFNELLNGVQDWDLALKIAQAGEFYYIQKPLYYHRIHTNSVTNLDKSNQLRKTNIVRRKYYDKEFNRKKLIKEDIALINTLLLERKKTNQKNILKHMAIFNPDNFSSNDIKSEYKNGKSCVFDARYKFALSWINFLREFNSFFDLILLNDAKTVASIIGYVWNLDVLYYS